MRKLFVWLLVGVLGALPVMGTEECDGEILNLWAKFGAFSLVLHTAQCALGEPPITEEGLKRAWECGEEWIEELLTAKNMAPAMPMPPREEPHRKLRKKRDFKSNVRENRHRYQDKSRRGTDRGFYGASNRH